MTDEKDEVTKGFSRLSDLASDVSDINEAVSSEQESGAKPGAKPFSSTQSSSITTTKESCSEAERKSTASPPPIETVSGGGGENPSAKWILGFGAAFIIFIIWAANNGEQSRTSSSDKPPSFSQSRDYPLPRPAPAAPTAPTAQNPSPTDTPNLLIQYEKPPVGTNNVLTLPQICWCIRENIRIEAMRNFTDTDTGIEEFNRIVDDYNGRCGSYRYREGSLETARRNVEAYRDQIVSEAIRDAGQLGRASQPPLVPAAVDIPPAGTHKRPNAEETEEAQMLLTELGYEPGPIDGDYGRFTSDAIKAFQKDMGVAPIGLIDSGLMDMLRATKLEREKNGLGRSGRESASLVTQPQQTSENVSLAEQPWITDEERAKIVAHCRLVTTTLSEERACIEREFLNLARSGGKPDLSGISPEERKQIESHCALVTSTPGDEYRCIQRELDNLTRSGGKPDLSGISPEERKQIESHCALVTSTPGDEYRCIQRELDNLTRSGGKPDLSGISPEERKQIESHCALVTSTPGDEYTCLRRELETLRKGRR